MSCKIFVINLAAYPLKKEFMIKQFQSKNIVDFEIIEGIDGNTLLTSDLGVFNQENIKTHIGRPMAFGEIGCALSHIKIYKKIIDFNISNAIILEDDAEIIDSIDIADDFNYDIILLGSTTDFHNTNNSNIRAIYNKNLVKHIHGGFGYYISIDGAKKMLDIFSNINFPIDSWLNIGRLGVNIGFMSPPIINVNKQLPSHMAVERQSLIDTYRR